MQTRLPRGGPGREPAFTLTNDLGHEAEASLCSGLPTCLSVWTSLKETRGKYNMVLSD